VPTGQDRAPCQPEFEANAPPASRSIRPHPLALARRGCRGPTIGEPAAIGRARCARFIAQQTPHTRMPDRALPTSGARARSGLPRTRGTGRRGKAGLGAPGPPRSGRNQQRRASLSDPKRSCVHQPPRPERDPRAGNRLASGRVRAARTEGRAARPRPDRQGPPRRRSSSRPPLPPPKPRATLERLRSANGENQGGRAVASPRSTEDAADQRGWLSSSPLEAPPPHGPWVGQGPQVTSTAVFSETAP